MLDEVDSKNSYFLIFTGLKMSGANLKYNCQYLQLAKCEWEIYTDDAA